MKRSRAGSPMSNAARNSAVVAGLALALHLGAAAAAETGTGDAAASTSTNAEERALSGTSVIGNREVPKSLYIVPWKNSEVGVQTDLSRDLLDEGATPVDPREFRRQVDFYEFHHKAQ